MEYLAASHQGQDFKGDAEAAAALLGFRGERPSSLALYRILSVSQSGIANREYSIGNRALFNTNSAFC